MKKFIKIMLLITIIVTLFNHLNWDVRAKGIDEYEDSLQERIGHVVTPPTQKGTVSIYYKSGDFLLNDVEFRAYQITSLGEYYEHVVEVDFAPCKIDINKLHDSDYWSSLRGQLDNYINANPTIKPVYTTKTNDKGLCVFKDLELGIYLIQTDMVETDDKEFYAEPILIVVGNIDNETGEWIYSYELKPKVSIIEKEDPEEEPEEDPEEPEEDPDDDPDDPEEEPDEDPTVEEESDEESDEELPQTGSLAYLIPIFSGIGLILILIGVLIQAGLRYRKND